MMNTSSKLLTSRRTFERRVQARLKERKEKDFSNFLKSIENVEFVTEHMRESESTFNILLGENTEYIVSKQLLMFCINC